MGHYRHLLNPFRFGVFSFLLLSHKIGRWLVPVFLIILLAASLMLATASRWYAIALALQLLLYLCAAVGWFGAGGSFASSVPVRVAVYFTASNAAVIVAFVKYLAGDRQETGPLPGAGVSRNPHARDCSVLSGFDDRALWCPART